MFNVVMPSISQNLELIDNATSAQDSVWNARATTNPWSTHHNSQWGQTQSVPPGTWSTSPSLAKHNRTHPIAGATVACSENSEPGSPNFAGSDATTILLRNI